jgi:hypothetical protein
MAACLAAVRLGWAARALRLTAMAEGDLHCGGEGGEGGSGGEGGEGDSMGGGAQGKASAGASQMLGYPPVHR